MAHSNRASIKASRGGMTKNQHRKAQKTSNSAGQSNRLQQTIRWMEENEEKKRIKTVNTKKENKVVKFPRNVRTVARRMRVIERLENQLETKKNLSEDNTIRINTELKTLRNRL